MTKEWESEPDREEWRDQATGLPCIAKRGNMGAWCGYVGVQPGHSAYGKDYNDIDVDVHGGLTYSALCDESIGICHVPLPGESDHTYWLGFDCAHADDFVPRMSGVMTMMGIEYGGGETYRNLAYVKEQCAQLAAQLIAL